MHKFKLYLQYNVCYLLQYPNLKGTALYLEKCIQKLQQNLVKAPSLLLASFLYLNMKNLRIEF